MGSVEVTFLQLQVIHIDIDQALGIVAVIGVQLVGSCDDLTLEIMQEVQAVTQVAQHLGTQSSNGNNTTGSQLHGQNNQVEVLVHQFQSIGTVLNHQSQAKYTKLLDNGTNLSGIVVQPIVDLVIQIGVQAYIDVQLEIQKLFSQVQCLGDNSLSTRNESIDFDVQSDTDCNDLIQGGLQFLQILSHIHHGRQIRLAHSDGELGQVHIGQMHNAILDAIIFVSILEGTNGRKAISNINHAISIGIDGNSYIVDSAAGNLLNDIAVCVLMCDFDAFEILHGFHQHIIVHNQSIHLCIQQQQSIPGRQVILLQLVNQFLDIGNRGLRIGNSSAQAIVGCFQLIYQVLGVQRGGLSQLNGFDGLLDQRDHFIQLLVDIAFLADIAYLTLEIKNSSLDFLQVCIQLGDFALGSVHVCFSLLSNRPSLVKLDLEVILFY